MITVQDGKTLENELEVGLCGWVGVGMGGLTGWPAGMFAKLACVHVHHHLLTRLTLLIPL